MPRVVMARVVRQAKDDGSFDREFWKQVDPAVRVEQTWVLASQLRKVKGLPRYTKGLDVWVRPTAANARRVHRALKRFGAPLANLRVKDLHTPGIIFQIGVEPNRIDVLTELDAVDFDDAWARRAPGRLGRCEVAFLSVRDLIANKRRVARPQDLLDVEKLRAVAPSSSARPRQRKA